MSLPRLSLCMIVRDEAAMLPDFLEHARGLWDELCVIDTGSSDATVEILGDAGAQVAFRAWDDDFAAARNASLDLATGEWICFFDPDERISPALVSQMRQLLNHPTAGAATVLMNNPLPHGHLRQARLLRMFRRDPAIRFEHAIHEDVAGPVQRQLERRQQQIVHLDGTVAHLGYQRQHAVSKSKQNRDLNLLVKHLGRDPLNLYSHFKLLEQCRFWQQLSSWAEHAPAARAALQFAKELELRQAPFAGELAVLVAQGLHPTDPARQLEELERHAGRVAGSAALYYARGDLHERLGHSDAARGDYLRCLQQRADLGDLQLSTVRPHMGLFRLALATAQLGEARVHLAQALDFNPLDPEALLAALTLQHLTGQAGVADFAASHRARHGHTLELEAALGDAASLGFS